MSSIFNTGVSGLLSYQAALATVSNNIANASNENYSRQVSEFESLPGQGGGAVRIGSGVELAGVRRVFDQFLTRSLFNATESAARLSAMSELGASVDSVLINAESGVSAGIQGFFESLSSLTTDPSSLASREDTLGAAAAMIDQFRALDTRFREVESQIDQRLSIAVSDINSLAKSIADLNDEISRAGGSAGRGPNDLLDRRDALLRELSNYTNVQTSENGDGSITVVIGEGLTLIRGVEADTLAVAIDPSDPQVLTVTLQTGSGPGATTIDIGSRLRGGELGGLIDYRRDVLVGSRNELGAVAYALFDQLNEVNRNGLTLDGQLGEELFAFGDATTFIRDDASPGLGASAAVTDTLALTGQDYDLRYDGSAWVIRDAVTQREVPFTGSGASADPLVVNGVTITVTGTPAAGDRIRVRPTTDVISGLQLLTNDPADLAIAAPVVASASLDNIGDGYIDDLTVINRDAPGLFNPVTITIIDDRTFDVDGVEVRGYNLGQPVSINGYSFTLNGDLVAGDVFTFEPNASGIGDNRNGLAMLDIRSLRTLNGGTTTTEGGFDNLVTGLAAENRAINLSFDAAASLLVNAEQERLALSGVNLDEEATNLLRFQQAYSASAEVIRAADELFNTLLGIVQ
ncbi:MAG: flagellar hook-associated protein FlgK [Pseudomonadota bacterium]